MMVIYDDKDVDHDDLERVPKSIQIPPSYDWRDKSIEINLILESD